MDNGGHEGLGMESQQKKSQKYLGNTFAGWENGVLELLYRSVKLGCGKLTMANVAQVCTKLKDASQYGGDSLV